MMQSMQEGLKTVSPIMSAEKFQLLQEFGDKNDKKYHASYKAKSYSTVFTSDIKSSLDALVENIISDVINNGIRTIILDDRAMDETTKALPMLMLVGRLKSGIA